MDFFLLSSSGHRLLGLMAETFLLGPLSKTCFKSSHLPSLSKPGTDCPGLAGTPTWRPKSSWASWKASWLFKLKSGPSSTL